MEDYEEFCKKHLSRIRRESEGETFLPVQHKNISLIQFNGIPVLSPLLTLEKRKELQQDRQKALDLEIWRQNSRKRILLNRVQEIVENVQMKKFSSQIVDDSEAVNIHLDLEPQLPQGFVTQSNSVLQNPSISGGSEPERASEVKVGEAKVVSDSFLEATEHFIPCKPEETCCILSEKRVCPEGASSSSIYLSPSSEAVKKDVEIVSDAEGPDPYKISLQNLLKKSREYVQREQSRRGLRSNSKRSNSESHSDKENDAVKLSDLVKERGKVTGRGCTAQASDKSNPVKSNTSLQNTVAHQNSVTASSSFSKVDIPMRSGTPPVLDSDSDEDFKNTSFFERGSILRSLTGSYAKLPSPEPSMSPKMHRRRPRPSSVGHIVISNPVNAYELSPKEKGRAVDLRKQDGADRQTVSDPVPKLTSDFASLCPGKVHPSYKRSPDICDEVGVGKQSQVRQLPADQQKNKRFSVSAAEDGRLVLDDGEVPGAPLLNPGAQEVQAVGCPITMQNPVNVSGAKQILEKITPTELNKSYDVERPSPLLMQMQRKQQMDTPNVTAVDEQILENRVEKVKRRLEMETVPMQKEKGPCVVTAETDPQESPWPLDQRCPLGAAFGAKTETSQRSSSEAEALNRKMLAFEELRKRLEEQHAQQLSFLMAEQEREQERLRKEIAEQEWRLKGGETPVSEMEIPQIAIHSEMDLEWSKAGDANLLTSVLSHVETTHSTVFENAGFTSVPVSGLTTEPPFYLWEPPASGKSISVSRSISTSRSISRSKMRWSQVYSPEMKRKLNKISALAKGFLTRRLLQTEKLRHLRQTVKDTMEFIKNFQAEAPLKRGNVSAQDANLQERVAAQLRAALYDIHDIFFKIDVSERMSILRHDRDVRKEKMLRQLDKTKIPRERVTLSTATQKSLDRKKYLKGSEIGMPNKRTLAKQKNPENRVLQPNQGQNAPVQRLLSRQGTPKTSVKGAEQNRKKPPGSRMSNKALSGVYAGRIQRKKPNAVTT